MSGRKSDHQRRVEEFMAHAGQAVPQIPILPDEAGRHFRAKMILEESLETIEGLGFEVVMGDDGPMLMRSNKAPDLIEIVDGCADLHVVSTGTLSACGVSDIDLMEEVDKNNLAKFGPGSHRRADGKWMKPPTHVPPDILGILRKQA